MTLNLRDSMRERDEERIDEILAWAEEHPEFDTTFVERMKAIVNGDRGGLTAAQSMAILNIYEKWNIG